MSDNAFAEPSYRHHPGVNARPSGGPLKEIVDAAASVGSLDHPAADRAWHYGLFLIDRHFFWEAHEALEPVWMAAPPNSRERFLLQGLIQFANAGLKAEMGRLKAAQRLADMARDHLRDAQRQPTDAAVSRLMGIDVSTCQIAANALRDALKADDNWRAQYDRFKVNLSIIMHDSQ